MPEIGKISPEIFTEVIFPVWGAKVRILSSGRSTASMSALSPSATKRFLLPPTGFSSCRSTDGNRAAWFAIHIIISDSVPAA